MLPEMPSQTLSGTPQHCGTESRDVRRLAQGAEPMGCRVFFAVLHGLEALTLLQAYASCAHVRLQRLPRVLLNASPLRAFHVATRRELAHHPMLRDQSNVRLSTAVTHMTSALYRLPHKHRAVLWAVHAQRRSFESIARELGTTLGMTTLFYEQARAMLRGCGASLDELELTCSFEMLLSQAAAHWLCALTERRYLSSQFADWLLASPDHCRELLISCVDQLVLTHLLFAPLNKEDFDDALWGS
jgi:hypothetical protein